MNTHRCDTIPCPICGNGRLTYGTGKSFPAIEPEMFWPEATRLATLQARGDRLAEYAGHKQSCNAVRALPFEIRSGAVTCSCGYTEAEAEWRKGC